MKHSLLRLSILALLLTVKTAVFADEFEIDGIRYATTSYSTVKVYSSNRDIRDVVIPELVNHNGTMYDVTSIGNNAFYGCSSLASVTIPNNVTSIGSSAFSDCSSLTSVTIPNSVTSIGSLAFSECSSLASVTIGNGVTTIGDEAFEGCSRLASLTIPNSVTSIGRWAFNGCGSLLSVTIGNSVTSIGECAFEGCDSIKSVTLLCPTVESWFSWKESIKVVVLGNGVTTIGERAFEGCNLNYIKISNEEPPILYSHINANVLEVPNGCTPKYAKANNWKDIDTIYTCIGTTRFVPIYLIEDGEKVLEMGNEKDDGIEISENTVIAIPLTIINSNSLNLIMFRGEDITNSINQNSSMLLSVSSNHKRNAIYTYAYPTKEVSTSTSGTLIDKIGIDKIDSIKSLKLSGELNGTDILTIRKMKNLKLLDLTEASIVNGGQSYYQNYVTSKDKVGDYFFYYKDSLLKVFLPQSVTSIGGWAFQRCSSLASVTIPNSVTTIGDCAFGGCSSLASVTIPNSVTSIGDYAFSDCSSLASVTIGNSVTSIGGGAFRDCSSLTSVTIPNSVTSIRRESFRGCSSLASVTIGNSVTSIGYEAFKGCSSLASVTIPNSVTSIDMIAFGGCSSLASVTIGNSVTSIGTLAFGGCSNLLSVLSLNSTPPMGNSYFFDGYTFENGTLYVPNGCKNIYWLHPYWENFKKIEEIEVSSINNTLFDSESDSSIYNLNGMKVDGNSLGKGIYIKDGKKVIIK